VLTGCKQDKEAEELLVDVDGQTTLQDLVADPVIADCYGDTSAEKTHNLVSALQAQDAILPESESEMGEAEIREGRYELFLKSGQLAQEVTASSHFRIITPTPVPTPTSTPDPQGGYPPYFALGKPVTYHLRGSGAYSGVDSYLTLRHIDYQIAHRDVETQRTPPDAAIFEARHCGCQAPCQEDWDLAADPFVTELSASITTEGDTPVQRARKIYLWVERSLSYESENLSADRQHFFERLVERGRGHCAGQSLMFIALCRANPEPVPARIVCGTWMLEGGPTLHHWAEFYLEEIGWIPVDTTVRDLVAGASPLDGFGRLGADHISGCPTCDCPYGGWHFVGTVQEVEIELEGPYVEIYPRCFGVTDSSGRGAGRAVIFGGGFNPNEQIRVSLGYLDESDAFREYDHRRVTAGPSGQFGYFTLLVQKGRMHQWHVRCRGLEGDLTAEVCFWNQ
jgi:transglutaminase-like putative cysteine protease